MARDKERKPTEESFDELRERVAKECEGYATIVHCDTCGQICALVFKDFTSVEGDGWYGAKEDHEGVNCDKCNDNG